MYIWKLNNSYNDGNSRHDTFGALVNLAIFRVSRNNLTKNFATTNSRRKCQLTRKERKRCGNKYCICNALKNLTNLIFVLYDCATVFYIFFFFATSNNGNIACFLSLHLILIVYFIVSIEKSAKCTRTAHVASLCQEKWKYESFHFLWASKQKKKKTFYIYIIVEAGRIRQSTLRPTKKPIKFVSCFSKRSSRFLYVSVSFPLHLNLWLLFCFEGLFANNGQNWCAIQNSRISLQFSCYRILIILSMRLR